MTKLKSLRTLAENVEAGLIYRDNGILAAYLDRCMPVSGYRVSQHFLKAFDGSRDAASALHEALLPGWVTWDKSHTYFGYEVALTNGDKDAQSCSKVSEARAWLLAIIKALIAEEEN